MNKRIKFYGLVAVLSLCCCSGVTKKESNLTPAMKTDSVVFNGLPDEESIYDRFRKVFGHCYRTDYKSCPHWFGGISDANKYDFSVYVVGDIKTGKEELEKMLDRSDFKVKQALYSYKHLREMSDSLSSFMKDEKNKNFCKEIGFRFFSLSEKDNRIYVYLDHCRDEYINKFKKYMANDPCILFKPYENNAFIIADKP